MVMGVKRKCFVQDAFAMPHDISGMIVVHHRRSKGHQVNRVWGLGDPQKAGKRPCSKELQSCNGGPKLLCAEGEIGDG